MRDLLLTFLIPFSLIYGFTSNMAGLMVLNWVTFMRPYSFSYGFWRTFPLFQAALMVALVSALAHSQFRLKANPFLLVFLAFFGWTTISCTFAFRPEVAWQFYQMFWITFPIAAIFLFAAINDIKTWKWVTWVMAGSIGLLAFKVGASMTLKGGGHLADKTDGFAMDNNGMALVCCLALATLMGLKGTISKAKWRPAFYIGISMVVMAIIYTKSRGGFLTLAVILALSVIRGKHTIRNALLTSLVVALGWWLIPAQYFDRMETLENYEEDGSAMNRIEYWKLSWEIALEHPIIGIGLNNFMPYTRTFYPNPDDHYQVAHSVYFQLMSETGFVGFGMYMLLVLMALWSLHSTYTKSKRAGPKWVSDVAFWMRNGLIGYCFGSAFLNTLVLDFPWYFMFYAAMLPQLLEQHYYDARLAKRKKRRLQKQEEMAKATRIKSP